MIFRNLSFKTQIQCYSICFSIAFCIMGYTILMILIPITADKNDNLILYTANINAHLWASSVHMELPYNSPFPFNVNPDSWNNKHYRYLSPLAVHLYAGWFWSLGWNVFLRAISLTVSRWRDGFYLIHFSTLLN